MQLLRPLLTSLNFTAIVFGMGICLFQYSMSLKKKYLTPIKFEEELIKQNLDQIIKYREFN
jgi:hypothetical protein